MHNTFSKYLHRMMLGTRLGLVCGTNVSGASITAIVPSPDGGIAVSMVFEMDSGFMDIPSCVYLPDGSRSGARF